MRRRGLLVGHAPCPLPNPSPAPLVSSKPANLGSPTCDACPAVLCSRRSPSRRRCRATRRRAIALCRQCRPFSALSSPSTTRVPYPPRVPGAPFPFFLLQLEREQAGLSHGCRSTPHAEPPSELSPSTTKTPGPFTTSLVPFPAPQNRAPAVARPGIEDSPTIRPPWTAPPPSPSNS